MSTVKFKQMVDAGKPVGEVIGVDKFLVKVRGLQPVNLHAVVLFEDGSKGYVHHIYEDYLVVLHLGTVNVAIGMIVVLQNERLVTRVGKNYIGRVISVLGEPLDGKGPIDADGTWPVFHNAPLLYERELLDTPLETGITTLDVLFSIVRGQRMAMLGDGKVGKSALATQIAINQRSTDITTIYVLISKRRNDVVDLLDRLETNNALHKTIVIVATMFESQVLNFLAPYVGAAMGEYLWQHLNMDTLVVYDDLTSHAMTYREISLIAGISPGRDSYPGDMFYTHSQLVERAGKLSRNHACQTIIPVVYAPGGDITAYLPTNVMSMTDGQWILDMAVFKEVMRPAVHTGLSVTRVGGVGQNSRTKALAGQTLKALAAYRQAEEYAHFGSELSDEATVNLRRGKDLYRLFNQAVGETYSLMSQQFLLDIVLNLTADESIDMDKLKQSVHEYAEKVENDDTDHSNFDMLRDQLKELVLVQKAGEAKKEVKKEEVKEAPPEEKPDEKKEEKEDKAAKKKREKEEKERKKREEKERKEREKKEKEEQEKLSKEEAAKRKEEEARQKEEEKKRAEEEAAKKAAEKPAEPPVEEKPEEPKEEKEDRGDPHTLYKDIDKPGTLYEPDKNAKIDDVKTVENDIESIDKALAANAEAAEPAEEKPAEEPAAEEQKA